MDWESEELPYKVQVYLAGLEAREKRLWEALAEQRNLAQHYREALQEIRDRTPANQPKEWPHHHWYLVRATKAINHSAELAQGVGD